jgi:hypothetical protein
MSKRLARLESVWAEQRRLMDRQRLYAELAKLTRAERCARIVFLVRRRMQACGITAGPGESLADAAARTLHGICPSVGHLAAMLKQIFEEAEASGRCVDSAHD